MQAFDVFDGLPLRVLDIGCGQGRDALPLARRGFHVTAVDWAPSCIRDLTAAARAENLPITGVVADIRDYAPDGLFDILLIDRTLHMLAPDEQTRVLNRLLDHCADPATLLICDECANFPRFLTVLQARPESWTVTRNQRGQLFAQTTDG
jgi:2-polyprenyl-3-methyl-5-hydroxy-6-metoxy-1,4-benzoquinol methylase